ncbi:hypothetical protein D9M73_178080 [compost metagenome]
MGSHLQETAGELTAEQPRTADEKRRRCVGPPRVVRPEILHRRAIDRQLIQAERSDIEDVVEVTGVAYAEVDEQVVDQHPQQYAVDQPQYVEAHGLLFEVGGARPQGYRRLDRAFALQAHEYGFGLVRLERQVEQIVVLTNLAAGERQGIAGLPDQLIVAGRIGQIEIEMIERRIGQFQQPGPLRRRIDRTVMQVDFQPEH